jgi:hypothetical protein
MKLYNRIFALFMLGAVLFLSACKKDDDTDDTDDGDGTTTETTVTDDQNNIQATLDGVIACIESAKDGDFGSLIESATGLSQGDTDDDKIEWMESIFDSLPNVIDVEQVEDDGRFVLSSFEGTYTYSNTTKEWTKTAASGKVELIFPSASTLSTNDMTLAVISYTDEVHDIDGDDYGLPLSATIAMSQNGTSLMSLTVGSMVYEEVDTYVIPTSGTFTLYANPMTITGTLTKVSATNFTASLSISDAACTWGVEGDVTLAHSNYDQLEEEDVEELIVSVDINDLSVTADIDVDGIAIITDPTVNQVNALIDVDVLYEDVKIADLEYNEYDDNGETIEEVLIVYKDGTSENVEDAYGTGFADDLEIALLDWLGNW